MAIAMLNLVMIAYFFVVPESPRWLLATGSPDEAEKTLRKIAKWNGVDKSSQFEEDFTSAWNLALKSHANVEKVTLASHLRTTGRQLKEILATPITRTRFFLSAVPWFIAGLSYYGIFLSVKFVNVNKYGLIVINSAVEAPVIFIMSWVIDRVNYFTTVK